MSKKLRGWLGLGVGLVLVWRIGANVARLYKAGERVEEASRELVEAQEKNRGLKEKLAEVQTPRFMEREVREKLGYGKPGEIELVLPDEVMPSSAKASEGRQPNWVRWRRLYLGF